MIIRPKLNWYRMLFVWRGSVVPGIVPRLAALLLLSLLVTLFHGHFLYYKVPLNPAPFTLIGIALAIFLGFRNNASYERFWEGRKLWGALVLETRSLTRQAQTMSGYPADSPEVDRFVNLLIAFTFALKHQLRQTDASPDLERLLPKELATQVQPARFKPILLLKEMGIWLQQARAEGRLDSMILTAFDRNLNSLSGIVTGCERIANTPIPFTYSVLLHRTVYMYCFLLPFGLVDSIGWMTPIMTVFIGYTFIALDALISEIEDPFGIEPNDLALNLMSQTIEASLREMQGKPTPGFPPLPKGFYFD